MPSSWGSRKGMPGYDRFRTGLSYEDVRQMLRQSEKHLGRHLAPHNRRRTVLGYWHELKLQLYELAVERASDACLHVRRVDRRRLPCCLLWPRLRKKWCSGCKETSS